MVLAPVVNYNMAAKIPFCAEAGHNASPYDYRFLEPKTKLNERDYPVLLIYFDHQEEIIESTPLPTDTGDILEGYFMESYCFVEVEK
jgi:hypothetical protein